MDIKKEEVLEKQVKIEKEATKKREREDVKDEECDCTTYRCCDMHMAKRKKNLSPLLRWLASLEENDPIYDKCLTELAKIDRHVYNTITLSLTDMKELKDKEITQANIKIEKD